MRQFKWLFKTHSTTCYLLLQLFYCFWIPIHVVQMRAEASQQGHVEVIFGEGEEWSWREIQRGCFHSVLVPLQKITEAHTKMIIRIPGCGYMHIYTFFEVISFYLFFNFLKIFF